MRAERDERVCGVLSPESASQAAVLPAGPVAVEPVRPTADRRLLPYWVLVASHLVVDLYPTFTFALAASIQANLALSERQIATIIAVGPIVSGGVQPLFAWIGDKFNTRFFGPAGLAAGAVSMSLLGWADSFWEVIALQVVGLAGVGVYHPIAAAVAGSLGRGAMQGVRFARNAQSFGLAVFFTAGMMGGFFGPLLASRINSALGIEWLVIMAAPGLVAAILLWIGIRRVDHLSTRPKQRGTECHIDKAELRRRWLGVGLLFASNTMRFCANVGLYYMYKQWAQAWARANGFDDIAASARTSDLISATTLGMAVLGMAAGALIHPGREKWPTVVTALVAVPVVLAMPYFDPGWGILILAFLTSAGHFSVIPSSIAAAQRLLPHATGVVGSLLMGCGWLISGASPLICQWVVVDLGWGLRGGFGVLAVFLALAGVCGLMLPTRLLRESAEID